jgi:acyl-CoA reductase-like NAD-dependent aldehyde dehydrogenase
LPILDDPKEHLIADHHHPSGPIVPPLSFSTYEEAVERANTTLYGLGASIWSADTERANNLATKIEAGNIWVNSHCELDPRVPFGGHKESGIGVEWGVSGLTSYCNSQALYLKK